MEYPEKQIEVISGMSLPLVLETATVYADRNARAVADYLQEIACDTVRTFVIEEEDEEEL
jgi:mannose/fructose-specific phosphotransferase system component IIA